MTKRIFSFILGAIILVTAGASAASGGKLPEKAWSFSRNPKTPENSRCLQDRVIVKLRTTEGSGKTAQAFGIAGLDALLGKLGASSVSRLFPDQNPPQDPSSVDLTRFYVVKYTSPYSPFEVSRWIARERAVEYAEPWFIYPTEGLTGCTPNDTMYARQWHLAKVLADSAWCLSKGDTTVVIGIIDTGIQWDHPDLAANIYLNPGESGTDGGGHDKRSNGLDDDGNGKIDDYHGWDFGGADYNNPVPDNNPSPTSSAHGHGTHVGGIASAATNNVTGIAGMAYNCRILPVKASSDNDNRGDGGTPYIVFGFEGIQYAADMGAKVINCSWGGSGASQFEQDMINYAAGKGALVVAAAGNANSPDPIFPAGYDNVVSVASVSSGDLKTSYTNYNYGVDVSAPGGDGASTSTLILSTYYPGIYAYSAGTSMASPLVAGLAALVKSHFPSYTPAQIAEQVRVSCDDIYQLPVNIPYRYRLGKGRINAVRALTVSSPSLRMTRMVILDTLGGTTGGILKPNGTYNLVTTFTNYLQGTSSAATITLSTTDSYIQMVNGSFPIGTLPMLDTAVNSGAPFRIHISGSVPAAHMVSFLLTMNDGSYSDFQAFTVLVNPTFATMNVNNVQVTITNNGRVAFNDFPTNSQGVGFVYGGGNQLFEGGLVIGSSATALVDAVRNDQGNVQDADFSSSNIYNIVTPGVISDQDGSANFTDALAPAANKIGLSVNTHSYAFRNPPNDNYVIVQYDVKNTSGSALSNLYVGMFFDWDMLPNYATNKTAYDAARSLGYAWDDSASHPVYAGVRALNGAAGYRGLVNNLSLDLTRAGKFTWLSGGVVTSDSVADIHMAISSGPFAIPNGGTRAVAFALVGGTDLANLRTNADAAQAKWDSVKGLTPVEPRDPAKPLTFRLNQNYPNPFNPSTTIAYELPKALRVTLEVFDVLGRTVARLVKGEQQPGRYEVNFDAASLSSGVYYYRLTAGGYTDVKKLLVLR